MKHPLIVAFLALSVVLGLLFLRAVKNFPNVDEVGHWAAAHYQYQFGRNDLYRVNPPLVQKIASVGVSKKMASELPYAWVSGIEYSGLRYEFLVGIPKIRELKFDAIQYFKGPRLALLPVTLIGMLLMGVVVSKSIGGILPPILAMSLWCCCPNLLAHSPIISPDVLSVTAGLLVTLAAWHYVLTPNRVTSLFLGITVGIALLTKLTLITYLVSVPLACLCASKIYHLHSLRWKTAISHILLVQFIAVFVLNIGYGFEDTCLPLGSFHFISQAFSGRSDPAGALEHGNRFANTFLSNMPMPIPRNYLYGIDYLRMEVEQKQWSFLLGEWKFGGWPHYYVLTTLFKTPEGTLLAAAIGLCSLLMRLRRATISKRTLAMAILLTLPAMTCFAAVSLQGGFNHHHRYVLFVYPPMFFFAALVPGCFASTTADKKSGSDQEVAETFEPMQSVSPPRDYRFSSLLKSIFWRYPGPVLALLLLGLTAYSSFRVHPHYTSYFNQISGGPTAGWRLLGFSNIDWGQDLCCVKSWISSHPECRPLSFCLDYFLMDGELFGQPTAPVPELFANSAVSSVRGDKTQWWIVNVKRLYNQPNAEGLQYLQQIEPIDRIGYAYHVYRIDAKPSASVP